MVSSPSAVFEVQVAQDTHQAWSPATFVLEADTLVLHVSVHGAAGCSFPLVDGCSLDALSNRTYLLRHRSFADQVLFRSPRQASELDSFMVSLRLVMTTPFWSVARLQVDVLVKASGSAAWDHRQLVLWGKSLFVFDHHECVTVYNTSRCAVEGIHHLTYRWLLDGTSAFWFRCPSAVERCQFLEALVDAMTRPTDLQPESEPGRVPVNVDSSGLHGAPFKSDHGATTGLATEKNVPARTFPPPAVAAS